MIKPDVLVQFKDAAMGYGHRVLWQNLSLTISSGEFVVLLGPNGTGKTSMLNALLGSISLRSGQVVLAPNLHLSYVPQIKAFDPKLPLRGRDLVALGLDGKHYCWGIFNKLSRKRKQYLIDQAIAEVNAQSYANVPLTMLSGGERQRLRIAQALVSQPKILILDEPLSSLDIASQNIICDILAHQKSIHNTAICMVTHEINPILKLVDKVIYFANGNVVIGHTDEVMTSKVLSALFGISVTVIRKEGKIFFHVDNQHYIEIKHLEENT